MKARQQIQIMSKKSEKETNSGAESGSNPSACPALVDRLKAAAIEFQRAEQALGDKIESDYGIKWEEVDVDTSPWTQEYSDIQVDLDNALKVIQLQRQKSELEERIKQIEEEIRERF